MVLVRTKLTSMQSLMPLHCFRFEIQIIKNGFTGPISYPVFRETGPRFPFRVSRSESERPSEHSLERSPPAQFVGRNARRAQTAAKESTGNQEYCFSETLVRENSLVLFARHVNFAVEAKCF